MPVFRGRLTRLSVSGGGGSTDEILEAIRKEGFRAPLTDSWRGEIGGWVHPDAPFRVPPAFEENVGSWHASTSIRLAWRTDVKVVPAARVRGLLAEAMRAWCVQHARERVPTAVREDLREAIVVSLLPRTQPRTSVTRGFWMPDEGWILLATGSDGVLDRWRKALHRTFGAITSAASIGEDLPEETIQALGAIA